MKKYFNLCTLLAATITLSLNFTACNSLDPGSDLIFEPNPVNHSSVLHMDDPIEESTGPE